MLTAATLGLLGIGSLMALPQFKTAPREFRAAWVATVDNIDWPSKKTLTAEQQQKELTNIFDKAQQAGLNAIIFQIRTSCDSLYASEHEPWSEFLTGRQGKPPSPFYDPLEKAIEEAHARGMELHAWFNPYRAKHFKATGPLSETHIFQTRPDLAKIYGRYLWLDPGEPEVQNQSLKVMLDVVERYDVDGVHIDDYFYPYEEKDAQGKGIPFPDEPSYAKYQAAGGTLGKADWRRQNVDGFIKRLHEGIKAKKGHVKFGISPFGIARPNQPEGVKAGIDQYDHPLYADCRKWFAEGWCDYFTPQLYWKIDSPGQPYEPLLKWWVQQNKTGKHLWPGNFTSRIMSNEGDWPLKEIEDQIKITRKTKGATGNVHFSFKSIQADTKGILTTFRKSTYRQKALIPASPWLGNQTPKKPSVKLFRDGSGAVLRWPESLSKEVRWWAIYASDGKTWSLFDLVDGSSDEMSFFVEKGTKGVAVTAVSASGIEGPPHIFELIN